MSGRRRTLAGSLAVLFCVSSQAAFAFEIPPNDGFITDEAHVLSTGEEGALERMLREYQQSTSNEIAVLILPTIADQVLGDLAFAIGREWGVGTKENDNGILILVSMAEREMFMAVGYGLEGPVPDLVAKGIIEEDILPQFRDGEHFQGLVQGIESLQKHIGGEYTAHRYARQNERHGFWAFIIFFLGFFFEFVAAFFARSKSWWLGGVVGAIVGVALTIFYNWWLSIPILTLVGLLLDYVLSKNYTPSNRRSRSHWGGGFGGSGRGGGGFGGFSGGSFGGGGAGGRW